MFELKSFKKRDDPISEGGVFKVVRNKMGTAYFLGFLPAEPRDDKASTAVARAPTHFEEVFGVLNECSNEHAGYFVNRERFAD